MNKFIKKAPVLAANQDGGERQKAEAATKTMPTQEPPVNHIAHGPNLTEGARYALEYAGLGRLVFPCRALDKRPVADMTWRTLATTDRETILAWAEQYPGCNWAMDAGRSGLCVLDVDNKTKRDGDETLSTLTFEHDIDLEQDTFTVATPNNGRHLYFSGTCKSTQKLNLPDPKMKGIETKSVGGYVLIPGSRFLVNGVVKTYQVVNEKPVLPVPDALLDMAGQPGDAPSTDPGERLEAEAVALENADNDVSIAWAASFLAEVAEEATYGSRNPTVFQVTCRLRDHGITESTAVALMESIYNPHRVHPPLESAELRFTIRNAYTYSSGTFGAKAPDFGDIPWEHPLLRESSPAKFGDSFCMKDLDGKTAPPREWVIRGWLPLGEVTSLYGDGGQGKSTLALQLAVSIVSGEPFLGLEIERQIKVLAVMCEDTRDEIHRRYSALRSSPGYVMAEYNGEDLNAWSLRGIEESPALVMQSRDGKVSRGGFYRALDARLSTMGTGPKLLILDTLADFYDGSEIDRREVNQFIKIVLGGLAMQHNLTVLILAHPSESGKRSGTNTSGSTAWNNSVRSRWTLAPLPGSDLRVLTRVKSNYAKAGERIALEWSRGAFQNTCVDWELEEKRLALTTKGTVSVERVCEVLKRMGGSCDSKAALEKALSDSHGVAERTTRDWITKAAAVGRITENPTVIEGKTKTRLMLTTEVGGGNHLGVEMSPPPGATP